MVPYCLMHWRETVQSPARPTSPFPFKQSTSCQLPPQKLKDDLSVIPCTHRFISTLVLPLPEMIPPYKTRSYSLYHSWAQNIPC